MRTHREVSDVFVLDALLTVTGLLLGFALPGYLVARLLGVRSTAPAAFVVSAMLLYQVVFWLGIAGIAIRFLSVTTTLVIVTACLGLAARDRHCPGPAPASLPTLPSWREPAGWSLGVVACVCLICLLRSMMQPLSGWDTLFRWDALPRAMLDTGGFDFYPPRTAEHFRHYVYTDGIPPFVQFCTFWIYAGAGSPVGWLTGLFVTTQFMAMIWGISRLAGNIAPDRGAMHASLIAVSSALLFWAVEMGQETGMTAMCLVLMLVYLEEGVRENSDGVFCVAGIAAAGAALSREYGAALVLPGLVFCLHRRIPRRRAVVFVATAAALTAPWYIRNLVLTGNPLYSNFIGSSFPTNPVHVGLIKAYESYMRIGSDPAGTLRTIIVIVFLLAPAQALFGVPGLCLRAKRDPHLACAVVISVGLWLYSLPKVAGGTLYSMRALSPALAILSVSGACAVARMGERPRGRRAVSAALLMLALVGGLQCLTVPFSVWSMPPRFWPERAFGPLPTPADAVDALTVALPPGTRVLCDNGYFLVELNRRGYDSVPAWSPEVRFLFEEGTGAESAIQRLRALDITHVFYNPGMNHRYLDRHAFFAEYRDAAQALQSTPGWTLYQLPEISTER